PSHWNGKYEVKELVALAECARPAIYLIASLTHRQGHQSFFPTTFRTNKSRSKTWQNELHT
ncbi:hypothetical protein, partial [Polaromonas sp.]|uniref:hypothetical protein n=1 Tax=Polaromonas sp. TaxID=1869339 RepID=UPI0027373805